MNIQRQPRRDSGSWKSACFGWHLSGGRSYWRAHESGSWHPCNHLDVAVQRVQQLHGNPIPRRSFCWKYMHGHLPALCSSRLHNLASEMEGDQPDISTPAGLPGPPQRTLPGSNLLSEIARDGILLLSLATSTYMWLRGRCWRTAEMSPHAQPPLIGVLGEERERAACIAFASCFQPPVHLVSVPGRSIVVGNRAGCGC
jgi:hypothetical protein